MVHNCPIWMPLKLIPDWRWMDTNKTPYYQYGPLQAKTVGQLG